MSLKALPIPPVPEDAACVAHAAFPRGNMFMQVRDTLGTIYTDEAKARPVSNPWPTRSGSLAVGLVTIFQFMESLTDRQEAFAVRDRIAWKYTPPLGTLRSRC